MKPIITSATQASSDRTTTQGSSRGLRSGFALVITISLLVLLALVAVGLLTLSTVTVRSSNLGNAQTEARANAKLALILAVGELQKTLGPDQRISAPSGILDSDFESEEPDGLDHPYLTGVWEARRETLEEEPDYDREKSFVQWLVSHGELRDLERVNFASSGSFEEEALLAETGTAGGGNAKKQVQAGIVEMDRGAYAWWVGDENCKARVNPRDLQDRESDNTTADLLASFATTGAHGIQGLPDFEDFKSNTEESDKVVSLDSLQLAPSNSATPSEYFHDLTPYSESVLTSVTTGSLRRDLSLFLEREDIDWQSPWGRAEGVRRRPAGPLGPNGLIALSPPNQYDVLGWKTLYHWSRMGRQMNRRLNLTALNGSTSDIDPISNPGWNSGVTLPTPVVARMQMLLSYGVKKAPGNRDNQWKLNLYSYPVVTLWNPYNVSLNVPEYSIFLHTVPLEHTVFVNDRQVKTYNWQWDGGGATTGRTVMRMRSPLTLKPGESRILNYETSESGGFTAHTMVAQSHPYSPTHAGHPRDLGTITASAADRIKIRTVASRWESSGTSYHGQNFQTTFGFRCEPKNIHRGHPDRFRKQMFSGQVCWRREDGNPAADAISETNFPSRRVGSVIDAPTPFLHLDVRLKTLDEKQLPNKTWAQCIPSHPFAAATSTKKHSSRGVDRNTTFFAHPYTVTFEQKTTPEGIFQSIPYIGTSNTPDGQTFVTDREVPLAPLTSLAQLQNLPQYSMEGLNWSGYYTQNHAIGNSFASPGVPSDKVKANAFPFYLGEYFAWQGGDNAGNLYTNTAAFNVADYTIRNARAAIIDRSYAANHLLWDDYFFSSITNQEGLLYKSFGKTRSTRDVLEALFDGTRQIPNGAYQPHVGAGLSSEDILDTLVDRRGRVTEDAYLKAAAHLKVAGGFNINSTSVPAWTVMLGSAHLKRAVVFDISGRAPRAQDPAKFVVSRFTMPNGPAADNGAADEDLRWRGYRELTEEEIDELARAIVRQVKQRGPFRSLGEFINRRLGSSSDEMSLYGALQAALEDEDCSINDRYRTLEITRSDIKDTNYEFEEAALGSRYHGTPACVSQADLLMSMGPVINARSDTFVVRGYGESRSADGKTVQARAWCEAVVQRQPEYLDSEDEPETAVDDLSSDANKLFGRQFKVRSFRWLSEKEIENHA